MEAWASPSPSPLSSPSSPSSSLPSSSSSGYCCEIVTIEMSKERTTNFVFLKFNSDLVVVGKITTCFPIKREPNLRIDALSMQLTSIQVVIPITLVLQSSLSANRSLIKTQESYLIIKPFSYNNVLSCHVVDGVHYVGCRLLCISYNTNN